MKRLVLLSLVAASAFSFTAPVSAQNAPPVVRPLVVPPAQAPAAPPAAPPAAAAPAPSAAPATPAEDEPFIFGLDGPFRVVVACKGAYQGTVVTLEKMKNGDVFALLAENGRQRTARIATNTESCFAKPMCRTIKNASSVVVTEAPACGGNGIPELHHVINLDAGRMSKVNAKAGMAMGFDLQTLDFTSPEMKRFFPNSSPSELIGSIAQSNNNDALFSALPGEYKSFFTTRQTSIVFMLGDKAAVARGSFKGSNYNGVWSGRTNEGVPVSITTRLKSTAEGVAEGVGSFKISSFGVNIEWSSDMF